MDRRVIAGSIGGLVLVVAALMTLQAGRSDPSATHASGAPAEGGPRGSERAGDRAETSVVRGPDQRPSPDPAPDRGADQDRAPSLDGDPSAGEAPDQGSTDQASAPAPEAVDGPADPSPPTTASPSPTTGTLSPGAIRDVVRENAAFFRFCFEWELNRHPELAGRLTMAFVIAEDGSVREARVLEDGLENETVTRCFEGVTSRMSFPPPEDGEVTVHYPFILDGAPPPERPAGI